MPTLASLGLDVNPSTEPLRYPGPTVTRSCLLAGSWLYRIVPEPAARVGVWRVEVEGGPLSPPTASSILDRVLTAAGVPALDERYPVLAIGSNAAPGQLRYKFSADPGVSDVVPVTEARVRGLAVCHAAHVSAAGYVPYVPVADPVAIARTFVLLWLDAAQLAHLDSTEPNYRPNIVAGGDAPLVLASGNPLSRYGLYRGRWGALRLASGAAALAASTQAEVYQALARLAWFADLVPEVTGGTDQAVAVLRVSADRRHAVTEAFARHGLAAADGLACDRGRRPIPYRQFC